MSDTIIRSVELATFSCGKCGGTYAIAESFRLDCYRNGTGWNCPYCKITWGYYTHNMTAENERLKRQLESSRLEASRQREYREAAEHSNRALRGVVTKKKKQLARVANGVCPCCNRHFENLERHIATKHPEAVQQ